MARVGAVVAGHICLDIIPQLTMPDLRPVLKPGAIIEIGDALLSTGGPVSNTGLNLHRLGIPTRLMAKVGDDQFGQTVLNLIRVYDPALVQDMIIAAGETSSYSIVISPRDVDRTFLHCAGANDTFSAADVPYEQLASARLFHFGYPPVMKRIYADDGIELVEIYRRAKAHGVLTSLDMSMPDPYGDSGRVDWRSLLAQVLPDVDFFMPSFEESLFMMRRELFDSGTYDDAMISELAGELLSFGAGVVVLKLGARGLYLRTGDTVPVGLGDEWRCRELWVPCFVPHKLVGTTGSGDATIAGFLAGVLREQPLLAVVTSAVAVGACNVEAADALSGVRSWEATQDRIAVGWSRADVSINAPGWAWDVLHQAWVGPADCHGAS